tara:strand:- start:10738 stop:11043 length:306 start_codon:yes stop_codon:yes gene_type:complete
MATSPTIALMLDSITGVKETEILELIKACEEVYDAKLKSISSIDNWLPDRPTVQEANPTLLKKNIPMDKAIRTFKELCEQKEWGLKDRLNSRFIVHCNIMS